MSLESTESLTCPNCHFKASFQIWKSVNIQLDPEAGDKVIDGTLFDFHCSKCGYRTKVVYPLLYHDMRQKTMIQLASTIEQGVADISRWGENPLMAKMIATYQFRVVDNLNTLREKAAILKAQLDDRVIELMKEAYLRSLPLSLQKQTQSGYFATTGKCLFEFYSEEGLIHTHAFKQETYQEFDKKLSRILESHPTPPSFVIDKAWARRQLAYLHIA